MPQQVYQKNCEILNDLISAQQKKLRGIMIARIIAFVLLILIVSISIKLYVFYLLFFTLIPVIAFGYLVKLNNKEKTKLNFNKLTLDFEN